ncbi:MAG: amino acid ABC transporter permease [Chloroflexi bacterium]|nr:MAG: amino acid ABC transporter permease [Chloroflexota bacterium]
MPDEGVPSPGAVPPPRVPRGPRLGLGAEGARALLIAAVSTAVLFGVIATVVVNAPGWVRFQDSFLNAEVFWEALPKVLDKFWVNVRLFLIAEVLILVFGLVLAILRSLPGPVFFPVRLLATIYVDLFRALPGLLVIFMLGFGMPALRIEGVPKDQFFWGVVALSLLYSAYVSEVYRAGIESVHPSQDAAARSLGLSRFGSLRYVVIPQAIRRVIPPLLNDFIGLQKDTVLVSSIGLVEIFRQTQILQAARFNFTPYLATALVFLVMTIPLARLVDWLLARQSAQRTGGSMRALAARRGAGSRG